MQDIVAIQQSGWFDRRFRWNFDTKRCLRDTNLPESGQG